VRVSTSWLLVPSCYTATYEILYPLWRWTSKKSQTKFVCTQCRRDTYRNPKGAVAILLFDDQGRIALARRAYEPEKGKLDPIGGFLDVGEDFEQAFYRELLGYTSIDTLAK